MQTKTTTPAQAMAAVKAAATPDDLVTYNSLEDFLNGHVLYWQDSDDEVVARHMAMLDALVRNELGDVKHVLVYDPEFCSVPEVEDALANLEELPGRQWFYLSPRNLDVYDAAYWWQAGDDRLYRFALGGSSAQSALAFWAWGVQR